MTKQAKKVKAKANDEGDVVGAKEAGDKAQVYDSLQLAHKCILNSVRHFLGVGMGVGGVHTEEFIWGGVKIWLFCMHNKSEKINKRCIGLFCFCIVLYMYIYTPYLLFCSLYFLFLHTPKKQ